MAWDFETDPDFQKELDWVDRFVREKVEPLDHVLGSPYDVHDPKRNALVRPLQARGEGAQALGLPSGAGARRAGLRAGQARAAQRDSRPLVASGRSVFGCQAPDSGNAEILAHYGTPEQKERYLQPLLDNEIVSCFSMTEPQGGADPGVFTTRAEKRRRRMGDQRREMVLLECAVRVASSS